MLEINFLTESNLENYSNSVEEYNKIWAEDGSRIFSAWEKATNLKFKETFINAVVADLRSSSHPLTLRYDYELDRKKSVLVHELGHRILYKRINGMRSVDSTGHHKLLNLVLPDVLMDLYGDDFLLKTIEFEKQLSQVYKDAWNWSLDFTKEERTSLFEKVMAGDISLIK